MLKNTLTDFHDPRSISATLAALRPFSIHTAAILDQPVDHRLMLADMDMGAIHAQEVMDI